MNNQENNLTLLILSKAEVEELNLLGYEQVAKLHNKIVPTEVYLNVRMILSKAHSKDDKVVLSLTEKEIDLLNNSQREYYVYYNNRIIGEDLAGEIYEYLDYLKDASVEL